MTKRGHHPHKEKDEGSAKHEPTAAREAPAKRGEGAGEDEELGKQIHAAEEEAKQHYDKLLRVLAEFDNFKKRVQKEREEQTRFGNEKLLADLLPALDDLDRVLEHVPIDASPEVKNFADGVALARKSLGTTLEKFGLSEVAALGEEFDPAKHEAIAVVESEAYAPNKVMAVHRTGYKLFDRLLRAAMVTVAKEQAKENLDEKGEEQELQGE